MSEIVVDDLTLFAMEREVAEACLDRALDSFVFQVELDRFMEVDIIRKQFFEPFDLDRGGRSRSCDGSFASLCSTNIKGDEEGSVANGGFGVENDSLTADHDGFVTRRGASFCQAIGKRREEALEKVVFEGFVGGGIRFAEAIAS